MVPDGVIVVEETVQQESSMQHRPYHVIQMADKRLPVPEMGVDENRVEIIVLKGTTKGDGKGRRRQCNKKEVQDDRPTNEAIHSIVILQRSLPV